MEIKVNSTRHVENVTVTNNTLTFTGEIIKEGSVLASINGNISNTENKVIYINYNANYAVPEMSVNGNAEILVDTLTTTFIKELIETIIAR